MRVVPAVLADAVAVVVFVALGRSAHHHAFDLSGTASTSWPFLAGLFVGWLLVGLAAARGRRLGPFATGLVTWPVTVALGMVLRVIAGQGTEAAFVGVALAFVGLFFLGWRLVALAVSGRRAPVRRTSGRQGGRPVPAQAGAGVDTPTPPRVSEP